MKGHITKEQLSDSLKNELSEFSSQLEQKANIVGEFNSLCISKYDMIENYNATVNENKNKNILTIGSYNIKGFGGKKSSTIKEALYDIYNSKSQICCIQECLHDYNFKSLDLLKTNEFSDVYFTKSLKKESGDYGLSIISNTNILSKEDHFYSTNGNEQRICQKIEISFNNKMISVYNTHLAYETNDLIIEQIKELKNIVQNDTNIYKVICGDFNTSNLSLFTPLIEIGFKYVNDGAYKTYKPGVSAIDNIFVSNNINILNSFMIVSNDYISDHNLLYADLEVK